MDPRRARTGVGAAACLALVAMLQLPACGAPLLPGEEVLGVDRAAETTVGAPGDRLGTAVAAREDAWVATAPGSNTTWHDGIPEDVPAAWVGWWSDREVRVEATGEVWVDGVAFGSVTGARAWAFGPDGVLAATPDGVRVLDPALTIAARGVEAVAWGTDRILALVCDPTCVGRAWDRDGALLGDFAEGGVGGAVTEWDGLAWAGAPAWDVSDAPGRACAEDGTCVDGLPGDHLGAVFGGGHTAGTFNKWIVPARARIVPLGGGTVLAMEAGAEGQPLALAGDAGALVIGAPYFAADGAPAGAVVAVPP